MARKSSKTAHVMNLLAGDNPDTVKSGDSEDDFAVTPNLESAETVKEITVLAQQASIQTHEAPLTPSPISIDMSSSESDSVSDLIRQQLEESFNETLEEEIQQISDEEEVDSKVLEEELDAESINQVPQISDNLSVEVPAEDIIKSNESDDINTEISVSQEVSAQETLPEKFSPDEVTLQKKASFLYLNVAEYAVKNKVEDYMSRLGVCGCGHCTADVTALVLNNITPKYIVVEPPTASPLLNYYSNRFSQQIIVELTKACSIVRNNPHH